MSAHSDEQRLRKRHRSAANAQQEKRCGGWGGVDVGCVQLLRVPLSISNRGLHDRDHCVCVNLFGSRGPAGRV